MRAPSRSPNRLHFTLAQFSTRPSSACISRFFVFNIHIYVFQTSRLIKILCTFYTFLQHASKRKLNFVYWRKNEKKLEKYIFLSKNCIIDCARTKIVYMKFLCKTFACISLYAPFHHIQLFYRTWTICIYKFMRSCAFCAGANIYNDMKYRKLLTKKHFE